MQSFCMLKNDLDAPMLNSITELNSSAMAFSELYRALMLWEQLQRKYSLSGENCKRLTNVPECLSISFFLVFSWIKSRSPAMDAYSRAIVDDYLKKSTILDTNRYVANDFSPSACQAGVVKPITEFLKE